MSVTQPLRDEHRELLPHVEAICEAARAVGRDAPTALVTRIEAVHSFLSHHLIPHAQAEDAALYPVVARTMGAAEATATMRRDHVEVMAMTRQLGALLDLVRAGDPSEDELRRVLYGLYAVVRLHFAKEEEVYLPLLDASLSQEQADALFEAMEAAAVRARSAMQEAFAE